MQYIDLEQWPRYQHFKLFKDFDFPHFNLSANVDITRYLAMVKKQNYSFTLAMVHLLSHAANLRTDFRLRIEGESVVEYDAVHPSITMQTGGDLFSYCRLEYSDQLNQFIADSNTSVNSVKANPTVTFSSRKDLLYITSIPWVSFTSLKHPAHRDPQDSIPRLAFGKYFRTGDQVMMPLSVQVHHGLMDGIHVGQYYQTVQELLDQFG
ncbi:CatA-like O-acetyltransferase [Gynuella sp.]|uniref:CatA-like O-acetyltransferase n=1 Tax=Gynuella sp. TaxID=2969146 RepID=UPI003D129BC4